MTSEIGTITPERSGGKAQISWGTIIGVLLLSLYLSYQFGFVRGQSADHHEPVSFHSDAQTITRLQTENAALKKQQETATQQLQAAVAAQTKLTEYLKVVEKNNAEMARDLALSHTAKAPVTPKVFMHISNFKVLPTMDAKTFRYLLTVSRDVPGTDPVKGIVNMTLHGRVGNKMLFIPVKYGDNVQFNGLAFDCVETQDLSGELSLPAQFEPLEVILQVQIPDGLNHQQQSFAWQL